MKDLFNQELKVGDFFIYHNASKNSKFSICKVLEVFDDKVICLTLKDKWDNTYRLCDKVNTYSMPERILKYPENMIPEEHLTLFKQSN